MNARPDEPHEPWTIGRLAAETGEEIRVVRFWTDAGLVPHPRLAHGHRGYGPEAVADVLFLRTAKQAGFSLDAISHILRWPGNDEAAGVQLAAIRQQIARLQALEREIMQRHHRHPLPGTGPSQMPPGPIRP